MFYCGISDEAGKPIEKQIEAHRRLGWKHMEIRNTAAGPLTDIPDAEFDRVLGKIREAGMEIACFASQLANWSRKITGPFDIDVQEMKRAVPRMKKAGTRYIRCMSYPNDGLLEKEWRKEVVRRLKELTRMAEDGGVVLLHENCNGWGGESPENSLALKEEIDSDAFLFVFDTGNPVEHDQDAVDFLDKVRPHIVHVHIKDGKKAGGKVSWTYPGDGTNRVPAQVARLLATGYDGGFSIEPHLSAIVHQAKEGPEAAMMETYLEYGRRLERIVEAAKGV
jgi:sugar phosphate isomerase/epimerase